MVTSLLNELDQECHVQIGFILDLLSFLLTHNYFGFDQTHHVQVQGVAMGTICAPGYTNLYLGVWEREVFGIVEELHR